MTKAARRPRRRSYRATLYRALGGQETTQAEARRLGAFVEDALTEADALAAADQEGTKE